jgi:hypothetical protein
LDSNNIFGHDPGYSDYSGIEPDKFVAECEAFFMGLKNSSVKTLSLKRTGLGPIALRTLATSLPAGVTKLVLSECPLTGGSRRSDVDKDLSGVASLFDALKTSSVTELDLRRCRLGPGSMAKLTEYLREATAALSKVDVRGNEVLASFTVKALRAAAPETCEILADH